jgi:FkbM family methyltransferase
MEDKRQDKPEVQPQEADRDWPVPVDAHLETVEIERRSYVAGLGDAPDNPVSIFPFEWPLAAMSGPWTRERHGDLASQVMISRNEEFMSWLVETYGEYIDAEVDVFRLFVNSHSLALDIGANCGLHTLALAGLAHRGTVFAVEPQRLAFQTLCGNLVLNGVYNVDAARVAVGATQGMIHVPTVNPFLVCNTGGMRMDPVGDVGDVTAMDTVDNAKLPPFDFMKIDVEGMEVDVLAGAAKAMAEYKPVVYLEFEWNRPRIMETLKGMGYVTYRHAANYFRKDNPKGAPDKEARGQDGRLTSHIVSDMLIGIHSSDSERRGVLENSAVGGNCKLVG